MNIRLICVGQLRERYIAAAAADFRKRLRPYLSLEEIEVRPAHGADPARALATEGERILAALAGHDRVWLLERDGTQLSSPELAARLDAETRRGTSRLTLIIAGAYGAHEAVRARADFLWSLSKLTFLHEWARAIVLEQLYRAAKIARNEPYHH